MKTKIIRKILAAMVAAATIASTAGVASAMEENDTYVVDETDMYEVEMDEVEDAVNDQLDALNVLANFGEFGDAADGIFDLIANAGEQGNLNVAYVLDISDRCSQSDDQRVKVTIANSIIRLLNNVNFYNGPNNMITTILEILQRCVNVNDARGAVANCLNTLDHEGLIIADDDLATAQNIRNTLNNNNKWLKMS